MRKLAFSVLVAFFSYYFAARLGLEIATINKQASPVWPATGIAIGLILTLGPRVWVGIFLGAFLSNFHTGLNVPAALAIATGNTLEALFFLWAFRRLLPENRAYGVHSRSIIGVFIIVLAAAVSATVGSVALWLTSVIDLEMLPKNWTTWWVGDFLGALFVVPLIYNLNLYKWKSFRQEFWQFLKFMPLLLLTFLFCFLVFSYEAGRPYLFVVFIPILLTACYFQSVLVYFLSLIIGIFSVWQTIHGHGPFGGGPINDNLIHLQVFLMGLSLTCIGISSLKIERFYYHSKISLLFGWILSGVMFYFSYNSMLLKDEIFFKTKVFQATKALENRMTDYIQMLESGVSFINASDYVSRSDWHMYTKKLLSTNRYPGIQGVGVIFSSTIKKRFNYINGAVLKYQPPAKTKAVKNIPESMSVKNPEDNFIITYLEPEKVNLPAIGLNISSEKHRYEAALLARDGGESLMTEEVRLVQDSTARSGFLIFTPIYKSGFNLSSVTDRRLAFLGFVYAPFIFEEFMSSVTSEFRNDLEVMIRSRSSGSPVTHATPEWSKNTEEGLKYPLVLAGKTFEAIWKKGPGLAPSISMISSWIGFFGTIISLFLAIMLSSLQNLTNRAEKIAQEMTAEVEDRRRTWQALTETSPVGLYLTDKDGLCTYVNPAWSRMTGLPLESAMGYGWISALHPEDLSMVQAQWEKFVQGAVFDCEYRFVRKDGSVVRVSGQATALRDANDQVTGYFGTVQDITQLHQNQMALITSSRMSSIGEMASGIAHEINNPLAIIHNKIFVMEKMIHGAVSYDTEKMSSHALQVSLTVQRIAKIIKGLQSFARETTGEPDGNSNLKDVFDDTIELCGERFENHGTRLIFPKSEDLNVIFWGRSEQISQVMLNLLNNSFDATRQIAEPWVKVSISTDSDKFSIFISDSGSGIPAGIQSKIFDPFFTTKEVGLGTGLGLSISKGIIERHKGRLYIDQSKINTTFVIELPLLRNETQKTGA